jgi:hypothetical protein
MKSLLATILALAVLTTTAHAQSTLTILPDYHLTPQWVKAGAYFKDNGARVKVSHVNIHVLLPVSFDGQTYKYKVRDHNENNVGEPDWSGWWDEPWKVGHFYYVVTATYRGHSYQRAFVVGRNRFFATAYRAADIAQAIAKVYQASASGQR